MPFTTRSNADRHPPDGGLRADRDDADPRHLSVDGAQPGSMGVPNPRKYDIDLLTPDGRSAEDGEQGQIVIRTDRGSRWGFSRSITERRMTHEVWHDGVACTTGATWQARRGRIFLVRGARRRRDQEFRATGSAPSRWRAPDDPSGRRRMCHHGGSRTRSGGRWWSKRRSSWQGLYRPRAGGP